MATRKRIASGVSPLEAAKLGSGNVGDAKNSSSFENETDVGIDSGREGVFCRAERYRARWLATRDSQIDVPSGGNSLKLAPSQNRTARAQLSAARGALLPADDGL